MIEMRPLPADFIRLLDQKPPHVIMTFHDLREFLLALHPDSNELLYHTHALTDVFSISGKLGDAYCHIPVYAQHLNLGFNKGSLLDDPDGLLQGTGKLIRHIPIEQESDYRNPAVEALVKQALGLAIVDRGQSSDTARTVVSKIKKK